MWVIMKNIVKNKILHSSFITLKSKSKNNEYCKFGLIPKTMVFGHKYSLCFLLCIKSERKKWNI